MTPFQKRVSDSSLVLISSTEHFVEGKDPEPLGAKNMTQQEAIEKIMEFIKEAQQLSTLPVDTLESTKQVGTILDLPGTYTPGLQRKN